MTRERKPEMSPHWSIGNNSLNSKVGRDNGNVPRSLYEASLQELISPVLQGKYKSQCSISTSM